MTTKRPEVLKNYDKIVNALYKARFDFEIGMKYEDVYGGYGMWLTQNITPYFWIVPVMAFSFLLFSFKRNHLFGPMQRYLITIMIIDGLLTTMTGYKDMVFNILEWNYGFIEYRACWILMSLLRCQYLIHATSLWIKSLMFIHRVLMFLFPFKMRQWNLKVILVPFFIFHSVVSIYFGTIYMFTPIKSIPTLQIYKAGMPLKKIDACVIRQENEYLLEEVHRIVYWFSFCLQHVYFSALPVFIHILCTILIIYLVRKEIDRVSVLTPKRRTEIYKNVKYLVIIKVHILLGISFMFQEIPLWVTPIIAEFNHAGATDDTIQALVGAVMFQVFAIGKPIDVIIYASLSKKVKSDLKKIFCCRKEDKIAYSTMASYHGSSLNSNASV